MKLRTFQKQFLHRSLAAATDTAALSIPRGNGKSWLAARILTRCLTPGDQLHVPGAEYLLCAASIEQARLVFRFVRADLEPTGRYRFLDSATRIGITHAPSNTKLRVLSSNGKTAMGIVNTPILVADEPGSWEVTGGTLMHDAIQTAQGKPGSPLKVIYIGTLAPAIGGWWPAMVKDGSRGSTYVQALQGDPERWDEWREIQRVNPLVAVDAKFRKKLLEERDAARRDSRLKSRFLSYRMNVPSADEATMLLSVADWRAVAAREVAPAEGRPLVGIDMGQGRAWSCAVAMWRSGRVEAFALAPGIPNMEAQERRDRVARGTYSRLADVGVLSTDGDRRVPRAEALLKIVMAWNPAGVICDRFRLNELRDAAAAERLRVQIAPRMSRWSEAAEDIRGLRKYAKDGPLSVAPQSRPLIEASLSVALVRNDDQGSYRLVKRDPANNSARDDVAQALTLVAGAVSRWPVPRRSGYLGLVA